MFLHYGLLFWLPFMIGLPVLIHLINLLRHQRVRWAAMDFLLESQKKNQNWIRFKELLLLLARVAALAAIVLMLSGPLLHMHFSRLFAGGLVHHVLLVDDSLSMSEQWDNASATANARAVVANLYDRAVQHPGTHLVTLLRFSDAAAGRGPDIVRQPMRVDAPQQRESLLEQVRASQRAAGPLAALTAVEEKIGRGEGENLVVYLISDFRADSWRETKPLQEAIRALTENEAKVQLVRCTDRSRDNLAITDLTPKAGILAADVPLQCEVEVTNYGAAPVTHVQVYLETQTEAAGDAPAGRQALPSVTLERIEPGQSARQSFSVRFPTAGDHEIHARLGTDALMEDNERFCVVKLPAEIPVLIVDGQPGSIDAQLLTLPRQRVRTGIQTELAGVNYLREQPLDKFTAIFLVNVGSLDAGEIAALTQYVTSGGSAVFFAGEATRPDFVTQSLYDDGKGIFPLPLDSQASMIVDRLDKTPDVEVELTHPIFQRTFAGRRNSFLNAILVERYWAAPKDWSPPKDNSVRVLARLRGDVPLMVEKQTGQGIFLVVLTTAAPVWNNWAANPSFVIAMMEAKVYLTSRHREPAASAVGEPLSITMSADQYGPDVEFVRPVQQAQVRETVTAAKQGSEGRLQATLAKTEESGIYLAQLRRADATDETRRFAVNVSAGEGNLATLSAAELQTALAGIPADVLEAAAFSGPVAEPAQLNLGAQWWFMAIVLGILVGEQFLAYAASYHLAQSGAHPTRRTA